MHRRIRRVLIPIFWVTLLLPVSLSHAATADYTYDALNRVIKEDYANGLVIEYTYDAVGNRLTSPSYMKSFQITVDTFPSGLQITADSVSYAAPQVFTWEAQSQHTLSTSSPQPGGTGVQYLFNAWSDGGAQTHAITTPVANTTYTASFTAFTTHDRLPTSNLSIAGAWSFTGCTSGTAYQCVDDSIGSPNNGADYLQTDRSGKEATFGFLPFTVPSGATIQYVRVSHVTIRNSSSADIKAALRVGGTLYPQPTAQTLNGSWTMYSYDWTTNPRIGAAWTVADVNGTGTNPLQGMGVVSGSGDESVTQVYVTVGYLSLPDTTPPVISNVAAGSITSSGATITWTTDEAADSQVDYGLTTAYGSSTTLDTTLVTSHSQALTGLTASTLYHYRVKSRDAAGNLATSGDSTFTTASSSPTTQDRLPTSTLTVQGAWSFTGCTSSTAYQCVDDPIGSPNNSTDYLRVQNNSGKEATFGFLAFTVPAGATIQYVRVTHVTILNSGSANIKAALRVGGTIYPQPAAQTLSAAWTAYNYGWTTNPRTGAAWTVADVNGTGSNPLQGMGVYSGSGDESVTQVYIMVGYQ